MRRDRLVGGQHELLDDLVALVVRGEMSANHLALIAQVDLDLGHVQLERAAREPAAAQDHGQLEHLTEHLRAKLAKSKEAEALQQRLLKHTAEVANQARKLVALIAPVQAIATTNETAGFAAELAAWSEESAAPRRPSMRQMFIKE